MKKKLRKYLYGGNYYNYLLNSLDVKNETPKLNIGSPLFLQFGGLNIINNSTVSKPSSSTTTLSTAKPGQVKAVASLAGSLFISMGADKLANEMFGNDTEIGRNLGNVFSSGLSSAGNTVFDNIMKGTTLTEGLGKNVGNSVKGAAVGLGANLIGQGITSLGGNSMLSRGIGLGVSTGIGDVGGAILGGGSINPINLGMNVIGSGLSAALGPSKEYGGKYGSTTRAMDTAYDAIRGAVGFMGPWGAAVSAGMTLNKGLSNIFGSTSGMTKQDAILGSAFMPAPVKWVNMWGAKTTDMFKNQSWLNTEKTNAFMGNAFGNLTDRFDKAREEAGKTYGTFSQGAYRKAKNNIDFANNAWNKILAMTDLDELLRIRSLYMTSINNLRYAQMIQGGFTPLYRGKQGMKIFNNATNHNMAMRLLSGAALIDNKQMILCSVQD